MLKKSTLPLSLCIILIFSISIDVLADTYIGEADDVRIEINGESCVYNDIPIRVNGSILLPLKELLLSLGVQNDIEHIKWDAQQGTVTIYNDSMKVILKPGNIIANVNGTDIKLNAMPINYKDKIYIPVNSIAQCFDKKVNWARATSAVIIWDKHIWDIRNRDTWTKKKDMPFALEPGVLDLTIKGSNGSITFLKNHSDCSDMAVTVGNKIYMINSKGKVAEYDPESDIWKDKGEISELKESKGFFKLVTVNNKIFIVGSNFNEILEYDPETCRTVLVTKLLSKRIVGGAAAINGKIYVLGGFDINKLTSSDIVEEYDIGTKKWTVMSKMPSPSNRVKVDTVNGKLYMLVTELWDTYIDEFDPENNLWTEKTYLEESIDSDEFEIINGKMYFISEDRTDYGVSVYDILTDKWTMGYRGIPAPRSETASAALNGRIYILGGYEHKHETPDFTKMSKDEMDRYFSNPSSNYSINTFLDVYEYTPQES